MNPRPGFNHLFGPAPMRRAWRNYWIIDVVSGLFDIAVYHGLRWLPMDVASWMGSWLVPAVIKRVKPAWIDQAAENYHRFFLSLDTAACRSRALENWRRIGRSITEFPVYYRFWNAGRITVEDDGVLADIAASGRPVMGMALHLGNWELVTLALTKIGIKTTALYMPPANRFRHGLARDARYRLIGDPTFDMVPADRQTTRRLAKVLSAGDAVVIYVDEYVRKTVYTPSFGAALEERCNLNLALRLATRYDAVPVLLYCLRLRGAHFKIVAERLELPHPNTSSGDEQKHRENQAAVDRVIEQRIRAHIDQWFNFHAWRPRGE